MADKPLGYGPQRYHNHCDVCGACLLFPAQIHNCPKPVRPDILKAFREDMAPKNNRSRGIPKGFQEWDRK